MKLLPFALLLLAGTAHADPGLRVSTRITPPLLRIAETQSGATVGFGGGGIGVTTPQSLWLEASASTLVKFGLGYDVALSAGYAFHDTPTPHAWNVQVPLFATYRYAARPPSTPTDGYSVGKERMNLVGVGTRIVFVRTFETNAIELGIGTSVVVPITRDRPESLYYGDKPTKVWVDAAVTFGFSFGL
ncbi:MAG: hypothetical protein ACXVEF_34470 [Polyangiales bacterium]